MQSIVLYDLENTVLVQMGYLDRWLALEKNNSTIHRMQLERLNQVVLHLTVTRGPWYICSLPKTQSLL